MDEKTDGFETTITFHINEQIARAYIKEGMEDFLDWMFKSYSFTISSYISDREQDFEEFVLSGGAAK